MLRPARKDSALAPHPVNGQGQGRHESCPRVDDPKRGLTQNLIRAREKVRPYMPCRGAFARAPRAEVTLLAFPSVSARVRGWANGGVILMHGASVRSAFRIGGVRSGARRALIALRRPVFISVFSPAIRAATPSPTFRLLRNSAWPQSQIVLRPIVRGFRSSTWLGWPAKEQGFWRDLPIRVAVLGGNAAVMVLVPTIVTRVILDGTLSPLYYPQCRT